MPSDTISFISFETVEGFVSIKKLVQYLIQFQYDQIELNVCVSSFHTIICPILNSTHSNFTIVFFKQLIYLTNSF